MQVEFPRAQEEFLLREVEEGRFVSPEEAVRSAVRDLERRQRALEEERSFVAAGVEQALRGDVAPIDLGEIRREGFLSNKRAARVPPSQTRGTSGFAGAGFQNH